MPFKMKQKVNEKNLKRGTTGTETAYKFYKNLFERVKGRSEQN